MANNVTITGIKKIDKKLSQLEPKVIKKGIRQVIRPVLKPIQQDVKSNVPEESGALKKGIKVRSGARSRVSISAQVEVSQDTYKGERFPGAFTEYGTKFITPRGDWRRAFDKGGDKAKKEAMDGFRKILDQAAK